MSKSGAFLCAGRRRNRVAVYAVSAITALAGEAVCRADITFDNPTPIAIPGTGDIGVGNPYPSPILVSAVNPSGSIFVSATIYGLTHTSIADVGILLVGPEGQSVVLMDYVGSGPVNNATYTFDQTASQNLPFVGAPPSGAYLPTAYDPFGNIVAQDDTFSPPAPSSGYSADGMAVFNGINPNGTWNLFAEDFLPFDSGVLAGGWSLTISTSLVPEPSFTFLLGICVILLAFFAKRRGAPFGRAFPIVKRGSNRRLRYLAIPIILCADRPVGAQALSPVPASPYVFMSPPAGQNSNVAVPSADGTHLFVSNQDSNTITVLNVAANGSLTFQGSYVTAPSFSANGMAINPAGTRLYLTTGDVTLNVHSIAADGTLSQLQAANLGTASSAENGIVYVSLSGGDFVFVNNNEIPNTVASLPVLSDGTLGSATVFATGGDGFPLGFIGSPRLLAGSDQRLYALNEASDSIAVFNINPANGGLTAVPGSPFVLPAGVDSSGAITINSNAANLYAGTTEGTIVKYAVNPETGSLSLLLTGSTGVSDNIDGLTLDPTGAFVLGVLDFSQEVAVLDTATMMPVSNSPFLQDGAAAGNVSYAGGILFNRSGTMLFTGDANYLNTQASVYIWSQL